MPQPWRTRLPSAGAADVEEASRHVRTRSGGIRVPFRRTLHLTRRLPQGREIRAQRGKVLAEFPSMEIQARPYSFVAAVLAQQFHHLVVARRRVVQRRTALAIPGI